MQKVNIGAYSTPHKNVFKLLLDIYVKFKTTRLQNLIGLDILENYL